MVLALGTVLYVAWPRPALAYIDPGTGSYLIQLLIAAAVGIAFAAKLYWRQIKAFFSKGKLPQDPETSGEE